MSKILVKFQWGTRNGAPNTRGEKEICEFRQLTRYNSETVENIYIVTIQHGMTWLEHKVLLDEVVLKLLTLQYGQS